MSLPLTHGRGSDFPAVLRVCFHGDSILVIFSLCPLCPLWLRRKTCHAQRGRVSATASTVLAAARSAAGGGLPAPLRSDPPRVPGELLRRSLQPGRRFSRLLARAQGRPRQTDSRQPPAGIGGTFPR